MRVILIDCCLRCYFLEQIKEENEYSWVCTHKESGNRRFESDGSQPKDAVIKVADWCPLKDINIK